MRNVMRRLFLVVAAALAAATLTLSPVRAATVVETPVAAYTLLGTLIDATGNYHPMQLLGNPAPPGPPSAVDGLHLSGDYFYNPNGQDAFTDYLRTLDTTSFGMRLEFRTSDPTRLQPVLMGGYSYRFLGIYLDSVGDLGIKYNNSNFAFSSQQVSSDAWHAADLRYRNGTFELYLDDRQVLAGAVGPLNASFDRTFAFNDYSFGLAFGGDVRNVAIYNLTAVPEPGTAALWLAGLGFAAMRQRRKNLMAAPASA